MIYLFIILTIIIIILLWLLLERQILRIRRIHLTIPNAPNLRFVHLSDLHHRQMGRGNCRLVRAISRIRPDFIAITGDLISRDIRDYTEIACFLRRLRRIAPVYLCLGNHELDLPPSDLHRLEQAIAGSGCRLLRNQQVLFSTKGESVVENSSRPPIYLAGADLDYGVYRDQNRGFRNLSGYTAADLTHALGERRGTTILLAHNPKFLDAYAAWGADLVLCGHVHGGIVRLPILGGLLSPERKFFPKYDKGLFRQGDTQMYVTGGIGKLRLFNPPEMIQCEMRNAECEIDGNR